MKIAANRCVFVGPGPVVWMLILFLLSVPLPDVLAESNVVSLMTVTSSAIDGFPGITVDLSPEFGSIEGVAWCPTGEVVYCYNTEGLLASVDPARPTSARAIKLGETISRIAFTKGGLIAASVCDPANEIVVLKQSDLSVVRTIPFDPGFWRVEALGDPSLPFVVAMTRDHVGKHGLTIIDVQNGKIMKEVILETVMERDMKSARRHPDAPKELSARFRRLELVCGGKYILGIDNNGVLLRFALDGFDIRYEESGPPVAPGDREGETGIICPRRRYFAIPSEIMLGHEDKDPSCRHALHIFRLTNLLQPTLSLSELISGKSVILDAAAGRIITLEGPSVSIYDANGQRTALLGNDALYKFDDIIMHPTKSKGLAFRPGSSFSVLDFSNWPPPKPGSPISLSPSQ